MSRKKKHEVPLGDRPAVAGQERTRRNAVLAVKPSPTTKRGLLTRQRLKEAAVVVLERNGYQKLRLSDIAAEAGVNMSLLYHYFSGKSELTREILTELLDTLKMPTETPEHPFDSILAANLIIVETYRRTPGLMRCLIHLDEEEADFARLFREVSLDWNRRVAASIARRMPSSTMTDDERLLIAYALGGMIDDFLFELFVDRNPELVHQFSDGDSAARFLAIMWYRMLYLANPDEARLGQFTSFRSLVKDVSPAAEAVVPVKKRQGDRRR